jgi:signal transduction histidine kinase
MNPRLMTGPQTAGKPDERELRLQSVPRPRFRRRFLRGVWLLVAVQLILGTCALLALQGPWRTEGRLDSVRTIASLAAEQFSRDRLLAPNPIAQRRLDALVDAPGVWCAAILDAGDRQVMSSGPYDTVAPLLSAGPPGSAPSQASAPAVEGVLDHGRTVIVSTPIGTDGARRLVLGVVDQGAARAILDGGAALGAGFIGTVILVIPLLVGRFGRAIGALSELHRSIRRLAAGAPPEPMVPKGEDEFDYLAIAFNSMAVDVTASQRKLREANAHLEERVAARTADLEAAKDELEVSNHKLAQVTDTALRFTDDVAHEFRTPLAVILEFASLVSDSLPKEGSDEQTEHLGFITDAARDLSNLVDDFLDTSRLRAGKLPVHRARYSVSELLDSAWTMLEVKAASRKVRLRRDIPAEVPAVLADLDKVRRVLINLAVNAIKFSSPGGEVVIQAEVIGDDEVAIRVIDHGPGMSPEEVESLFTRFQQTSSGERATAKGFGLGLSITAELVAICLGRMSVASVPGKGSTFTFTLPTARVQSVLRRYLANPPEGEGNQRFGAALVRCAGPAVVDPGDRVADLLRPRDLCIPCDDGESHLVVMVSEDVHDWARSAESQEDAAGLTVEVIGSWEWGGVSSAEISRLAVEKGVVNCG